MSAATLHESAVDVLTEWRTDDAAADSLRHTTLAFLAAEPRACLRESAAGHITASAVLLDRGGRHVLLTLHPRVGRWLQLGGHCEPDDRTVRDAALREAREESGIDELTLEPELLDAHTHPITCSLGVPTRHLDLRFVVRAAADAQDVPIVRSAESTDLRWWPIDALPDGPEGAERDALRAMIDRADAR
ncbi:NUDIX hydrolase [Rhodococcoides corynebacterioides]|uniref:NUDIX domain-containing protein n=1 Tax=Rhodococcoides corynebacterioides TaxID=53972 RepID=A0ABS7P0H9_9NOCA|nr:NUDIX domain-containing protein [Rhodococcus corynebacterioides]MBY6365894.1 NUDIX domain-containing protein [Rhodococcus corynebacterioides]MBY6409289.1 NUDIX domain-containing protein [Rhodococcus corynebacterioides]